MNRPEIYANPVQGGTLTKGFYVARKFRWRATDSFVVVMVIPDYDDVLRVFEPGDPDLTETSDWFFRDRIMGLKEATAHFAAMSILRAS